MFCKNFNYPFILFAICLVYIICYSLNVKLILQYVFFIEFVFSHNVKFKWIYIHMNLF